MSSTLTLLKDEFEHLSEESYYNSNRFCHKELKYVILEECDENYDVNEYYLIETDKKVFLGSNQNQGGLFTNDIKIDFKEIYT